MEIKLNDFVSFHQLKNGKYKIVHDESKRDNIFKFLRELGFGFIRQNTCYIYFKKDTSVVKAVTFSDFQKTFLDTLKQHDLQIAEGLTMVDVYKHFRKHPIKRNAVFAKFFEHTLVANEVKHFVLQHRFELEESFPTRISA